MTITRKVILSELRDYGLLILVGVVMTATGLTCSSCMDSRKDFLVVSGFTSLLWILLWKGNAYLGGYVSSRISWLHEPVKRFVVGIVSTAAYTFGALYLTTFLYDYFSGYHFRNSEVAPLSSLIITLFISLFMHSRSFLTHWRKAAVDAERLQKESIAARYESLKNQVNPHFLFNSFNALTNLVYEDQEKAVKFIKQLSEVYRYVLDTREKELVSLDDELKFLQSYLYLQQIRFGDKLKIEISLANVKSMVAPLVLQMLTENAIKHNIVSEENPLTIRMYQHDGFIVVENNLQKKTVMREESAGIGLDNICRRYEFLTEKKVEVVTTGPFVVKLPVIEKV